MIHLLSFKRWKYSKNVWNSFIYSYFGMNLSLNVVVYILFNVQCQDFSLLNPPSLERLLTVELSGIVFWRVLNLWLVHPSPLDSQPFRWKGVLHRRTKKYLSGSTLLCPVNIAAQLLMGVAQGASFIPKLWQM